MSNAMTLSIVTKQRLRSGGCAASAASAAFLLLSLLALSGTASAQSADPTAWRSALEGKTGHVTGTLEPRFSIDGQANTAGGEDQSGGAGGSPAASESAGGSDTADGTSPADKVLPLVREWIVAAEPPQNGEPGYRLRYTQWGQFYGTTPTVEITVNAKPDDAAGLPFDQFLWTRRPDLPSLNHCTLKQYVEKRLAGDPVDQCRGASAAVAQGEGTQTGQAPSQPAAAVTHSEEQAADGRVPIPGSVIITGRIGKAGDRDEFVFSAKAHGEWTITVLSAPSGVELKVGVFPAPNGNWLPNMAAEATGAHVVDLPKPGEFVLRVTAVNGKMQSGDSYRVKVSFVASPDVHEPNQTAAEATPVKGSGSLVGAILPRGERDEYLIEAPHHGEWKIRIAEQPSGVGVKLGVYPAPNGNWLPDMSSDQTGELVVDLPKPGPYLLRVTGADSKMRSVAPYKLDLVFTPSPDKHEPNQTADKATPIEGSGSIIGTILPRGERDEYLFKAPHHGEWKIRVDTQPDGVEAKLGVYPSPNGNWLPNMSSDQKGELVVDIPKPGPYLLRVTGADSKMRSVAPYKLDLVFTPSPDKHEPNQAAAEATSIEGSGAIVGTILPRAERDEYLFDAPHHGEWKIRIDTQPDGVDVKLGVYPAPSGNWLPDMTGADSNELTVDLPKPGSYLLRVTGADSKMRSVSPYGLALNFTPSPDKHEPNPTSADATPVGGSASIVGTILPRGERDEYAFEVAGSRRVGVRIVSKPEDLPLSIGIYKFPNGNWLKDFKPNEPAHLVVETPEAGRYVLRVTGANSKVRSVKPYRLTFGVE